MQFNMLKNKYTRILASEENKDEFASAKMSNLVWIDNISNERFKFLKDKRISNPYGNVYHKRRMSISCPSTPIRGQLKPVAQLLAEVSDKLLEESENIENSNKYQRPGNASHFCLSLARKITLIIATIWDPVLRHCLMKSTAYVILLHVLHISFLKVSVLQLQVHFSSGHSAVNFHVGEQRHGLVLHWTDLGPQLRKFFECVCF